MRDSQHFINCANLNCYMFRFWSYLIIKYQFVTFLLLILFNFSLDIKQLHLIFGYLHSVLKIKNNSKKTSHFFTVNKEPASSAVIVVVEPQLC